MEKDLIPDYIELHDLRIEQISVINDGKGILNIRHLPVYIKTQSNKYDIWSYSAKIEFEGISLLQLNGLPTDWIVDGSFFNIEGKDIRISLNDYCNHARRISMVFNNSSRLEIEASKINLVLIDAIRKIEEWKGKI
jgi:hypothetical protein